MTSEKLIKEFEFNKLMEKVGLFEAVLITYPDGKVPLRLLNSFSFSLIPCVEMYNIALSNNALANTFLKRAIKLLKKESYCQRLKACENAHFDSELQKKAFELTLKIAKTSGKCLEIYYSSLSIKELNEKALGKALKLSKSSGRCLEVYECADYNSKVEKKASQKALKLAKSPESRQKILKKIDTLTCDKKEALKVFKKR